MRQRALIVLCVLATSLSALAGGLRQQGSASGTAPPSGLTAPFSANMGTGTAAVSGAVIDGATRRPVAGVVVTMTDRGLTPSPSVQMFTDSKGRFVFRRLPASSRYELTTAKPGYFDGGFGKRPDQTLAANLVLTDGQWLREVAVEIWRPGAIAGTLIDEQGEPVVGVFVRAFQEIRINGRALYARGPTVKSDDRGVYRISDLVPGRYIVFVPSVQMSVPASTPGATLAGMSPGAIASYEAQGRELRAYTDPGLNVDAANRLVVGYYLAPPVPRGGRAMSYPPTFYPNATTAARATAVELVAGADRTGIDLRLDPLPAARLSGVVQSPAGSAPRFTLRLLAQGSEGLGRGGETATALVDENGRFVFLNVPAGEYVIEASGSIAELTSSSASQAALPVPPGHISTFGSGMSASIGPPGTGFQTSDYAVGSQYSGRLSVATDGRDIANLVVTLRPTVSISGRYIYVGKSPQPSNPAFRMGLEPANGDLSLGLANNNRLAGEPGVFRFEGLQPGEYVLHAPGSATNPWEVKSIVAGGRDYTNIPFDASGRDIDGVVVTFTDETATLAGSVRDAAGAVVSRAAVMAFPVEKAQWSNYGLRPDRIKTARVTSANDYRLTRLPAGDYFVVAVDESQESRWQEPAFLEAAARVATRVSLAWGDTKMLDVTMAVVR